MTLKVEAIKPSDYEAPLVSESLEPFSPTTLAARILKNLREHVYQGIKIQLVTVLEQSAENLPEYLDFYELDGDGINIMRTCEPVFFAEYDRSQDWVHPRAYRFRIDISPNGWCYFITEAFEELRRLNALQSTF